MNNFRLGRTPRAYDPRVPHMSALMAGVTLPPPPVEVDWTKGMPANLGMMLNDTLGDCTCAAVYHALQVWSFNAAGAAKMETEPNTDVEKLYELACGYISGKPATDQGGNEQHVLTYLLNNGAPMADGSSHKIAAFVEVDRRIENDVKHTIVDCGLAYIGFNVPAYVMPDNAPPLSVWQLESGVDETIIGGHAVILAGYSPAGLRVISWGQYYTMGWGFFDKFVDEVYAIADSTWIEAKGTTPAGLTLAQLETQMSALRG